MRDALNKLRGGDRRSIGPAEEVAADIGRDPGLFVEVFEGMMDKDSVVGMRAAGAIEKVARRHPEYLGPFKRRLLREVSKAEQQEVRWHVAQMIGDLELTKAERRQALD